MDSLPGDCGCDERQKKLNAKFPFTVGVKMTERQKAVFELTMKGINPRSVNSDQRESLRMLYNQVFNAAEAPSTCVKCINKQINNLSLVYENSCENEA